MERVWGRAANNLAPLGLRGVGRLALAQLDVGQVRGRHLLVEAGRVGLRPAEQILLVLMAQAVEVGEVVDPALGDGERTPRPRLSVGHDGAIVLVVGFRVARCRR